MSVVNCSGLSQATYPFSCPAWDSCQVTYFIPLLAQGLVRQCASFPVLPKLPVYSGNVARTAPHLKLGLPQQENSLPTGNWPTSVLNGQAAFSNVKNISTLCRQHYTWGNQHVIGNSWALASKKYMHAIFPTQLRKTVFSWSSKFQYNRGWNGIGRASFIIHAEGN